MKMLSLRFFVVLVFGLLLQSCIAYKDVQLKQVDNVKVNNVGKDGISLVVTVTVDNPNWFDINITNTDLDFYLNGVSYGKAILTESVKLKSGGEASYDLPMKVQYGNAIGAGITTLFGLISKKEQTIKVEGTIEARSFLVKRTLPLSLEKNIKI